MNKVIKDPHFNDCILVPVTLADEEWVKISNDVLPDTYYRVVKATNEVKCMVNILPDGNHVAWNMCSTCANSIFVCDCKGGARELRSIAWMWHRAMRDVHGVPMPSNEEIYSGFKMTERNKMDITKVYAPTVPTVKKRTTSTDTGGLTAEEISKIDLSALDIVAMRIVKERKKSMRLIKEKKGKK